MSERFAWIFDKQKQKKIWCADMWARKAVLAIQTAITGIVSRLTTVENAGYQTASDVSAAIASAIGGITELEYLVVSTLPASGTKGVVYLVPHQHGTRDIYDEYIWVNNAFEKIGSTDVDLSGYLKDTDISAWAKASTKPSYTATEVGALPNTTSIPSKTSDLTNDSGYITGYTETDPTVPAWAKASSKPSYTASEVGALPDSTVIPSKTSDLTNDSGFITGYTETDPTVPAWAKASTKPSYTASEVGALPDTTQIPTKTSDLTNDSDFQTGTQVGNAISAEVGLMVPYGYCTTGASTVAKVVTVSPAVTELVTGLTIAVKFQYTNTGSNCTLNVNGLGAKAIKRYGTTAAGTSAAANWNANSVVVLVYDGTYWMLADWNNSTYSGMSDAEYQAGTSTTNRLITPARLKAAIELHAPVQSVNGATGDVTVTVPTKVSDLTNDSGFITGYTETDPTVPAWAKESTKPSYTASEVGALPDDTVIPTVPTAISAFTNDVGYITGYVEMDPTVPAWAKAANKPTYTAAEVGALPDSTVIPGASSATPSMDGSGAAGSSADYARADHVHPHDTSKQDALTAAQLEAVNSGITAAKVAEYDAYASKFAFVTGTLSSGPGFSSYISYPDGFALSNCEVIQIYVQVSGGWRMGSGIATAGTRFWGVCQTAGVRVYNNDSAVYGYPCKVLLMRTDI